MFSKQFDIYYKLKVFLSGTIIEVPIQNLVSDAGGVVARRPRDVSKHLSFFCLFTVLCNAVVYFCHVPNHHCSFSLILSMVVGDLFQTFSKDSLLCRSFQARSFFTFVWSTWSPVRSIFRIWLLDFPVTVAPTLVYPLSHLRVKTYIKLPVFCHTYPQRVSVYTAPPSLPLSRFVPTNQRSTWPFIVVAAS